MILIELMKAFRLMDMLVGMLAPLLKLMGLKRQTGVLWLTGVMLGLSYGGAVIVQQARELQLTREEIEKLQLSIGMWIPRLLAAILAVYAADAWFRFRRVLHDKQTPTA